MPAALHSHSGLGTPEVPERVKTCNKHLCMTYAMCINPAVTQIHNRNTQQTCALIPSLFNLLI